MASSNLKVPIEVKDLSICVMKARVDLLNTLAGDNIIYLKNINF